MIQLSTKMSKLLLIFYFLAFFNVSSCQQYRQNHRRFLFNEIDVTKRIMGGSKADISSYPYQVSLKTPSTCGGSILSSTWVLTAAHCLEYSKHVSVRAGSTFLKHGGQVHKSDEFLIHPKYHRSTMDYDVAVISFKNDPISINNKTTASVLLASENSNIKDGTRLTVTGWGARKELGNGTSHLYKVDVNVVSKDQCKMVYSDLSPRKMCASVPGGGKDSCQGDSGGPLVETSSKIQYGIVSYGEGCGRPEFPGVYTYIPSVRRWINEHTGI